MIGKKIRDILSNITIVYVEDDENIRSYIYEFFKRFNVNIHITSNAEDGIELYKEYNPDILIVDINLPNMSGIEMISKIRKKDELTRVIITTAYTNEEFTLQAIELHITRYLVKPVTSKNLLPALEKAIDEINKFSDKYLNVDLGEEYYYNTKNEQLYKEGELIELRKKEMDLLKFFVANENKTVTYEMLENRIWEDSVMTQDAIRGQIRNLRKKTHPKIVKNISGVGYKIFGEN